MSSDSRYWMNRVPLPAPSRWRSADDNWTRVGIPVALLSAGVVTASIIVTGWLAFALIPLIAGSSSLTYTKWKRAQVPCLSFYGHWGLITTAMTFLTWWDRLDLEMKKELTDIYLSVVKLADGAKKLPDNSDSQDAVLAKIKDRADAVRSVATEMEKTKAHNITQSLADVDDTALETARLYAEAFRKQRAGEL